MLVQQIAVFIENSKGRIRDLTQALANAGIDLLTLSIADTSDFGILRMITRDNDKAVKVLKEAGFTGDNYDLIGVEVGDTPGGLAKVLAILDQEDINIEYIYSFAHTNDNKAIVLFRVYDDQRAISVLQANNIKLLNSKIV